MLNLVTRALTAKRESKQIEFKESFDATSPRAWCEIVKDLVAIANSGGGIIVIGIDNSGVPSTMTAEVPCDIDPADVGNKISKYAGTAIEFEMRELEKGGRRLQAFVIEAAAIPIVFQSPGTYSIGDGKQNAAFGVGTVYFRHGAKSEPGNTRQLNVS